MVQQHNPAVENISHSSKDVVRRSIQRSPTPESMQYGGGDSNSYNNNNPSATGQQQQQPSIPQPCCCGNPAGGAGNNGSSPAGGSSSAFQPLHLNSSSCPGCSSASSSSSSSTSSSSSSAIVADPSSGGNNNNNNIPASVKFELGRIEVCEGCGLGIADRYVMRVADGSWHEDCLVCCVCQAPLVYSCFTRSGRVYCRQDYDRVYGAKCGRCNERLYPHELVMRAGSALAFHLPCFGCFICGRPLQKGDQFVVRAGQLLCRADLEKDLFLIQSSTNNNNNNGEDSAADENNRPRHDGRRGPKRPRTILTSAQRRQFKASFEISPKPCRKVREALAKETGLSVRVVQVWFQNQRAKMKKLQRKAKIEAEKNGSSSGSSNNNGEKGSKDSKGEGKKRFGDSSDAHGGNSSLAPYSPNGGGSYAGHSGDSMCGSDLSLDDSGGFDQMDDAQSLSGVMDLQEIQQQPPMIVQQPPAASTHPVLGIHQHHHVAMLGDVSVSSSPHHHHQLQLQQQQQLHPAELMGQQQHPAGGTAYHHHPINPIDKLYLMQNAYFRLDQ